MKPTELIAPGLAYPPDFGSPTSLGIRAGDFIFVSGMIAWDRDRRIVGVGDPHAQTLQALESMQAVLEEGGASLADIVKITFYLTYQAQGGGMGGPQAALWLGAPGLLPGRGHALGGSAGTFGNRCGRVRTTLT